MKVLYPITLDVKKTNIQKHIKAFTSEGGTRELIITLVSGNDTIELTNEPNLFITSGWAYLCFMTSPLIRFPYRQEVLQMPVQA